MEKKDIEELRERVPCAAVLEKASFAVDRKESTRRAVKYRRGDEIIIVTHGGRGWFDPLSDAKGDVFSLAVHLDGAGFADALSSVARLVGFVATDPSYTRAASERLPEKPVGERWLSRRRPWPGSSTWRYLLVDRCIPAHVLRTVTAAGQLHEGPYGSMWAAHTDGAGRVTGWEERGAQWRGFATGGTKTLFRLGPAEAPRVCVTEAAIDAMSLATLEGLRDGSIYLSTGGGWSPATEAAIRALVSRPGVFLVAATDANPQGETFAERLRGLAEEADRDWMRLRPNEEDWNDVLKLSQKEEKERRERGRGLPHARRPRQG